MIRCFKYRCKVLNLAKSYMTISPSAETKLIILDLIDVFL